MYNSIPVGLGEVRFSDNPGDVLVAYGLGSCLGISVRDSQTRISGLLHAVLPENNKQDLYSPKYVDSGIRALFGEFSKKGIDVKRLTIKIVGGANMLVANGLTFDIGERNIVAAKEILKDQKVAISGEDVGGNVGRTMRVYVDDGRVTVRSLGDPEKEI